MATEEIRLNETLQGAGLRVVETDLGEWILQLAGQRPAHIISPAVHLDRTEIAGVFAEHGRTDPSDRPEDLNAYARTELRQEFLQADIGISGCNFAVAESGTVCILTNEGNGRMVTSVPPVHVVVMGMERVVETWEQLDLMMSLLPPANGVDLTVYVNMITGPRRPGELDGPEELHLIVLDNGRSRMLGTEFQSALHCIRCGACLDVCPVYRQIGGQAYGSAYSGPIGSVITPQLVGGETVELAKASTLCGACYDVCPVMIPLQDLLLAQRRLNAADASRAERAAWRAWSAAWSRPALFRWTTAAGRGIARVVPRWLVPRRWSAGREVPRPKRDTATRHGAGGKG
jgi:L-lactate dehydrogenase complex protein LldF